MASENENENDKDKPPKDEVTIHVRHIGELENANFKMSAAATLQACWDQAYLELTIDRDQRDIFQAKDGETPNDLMPHLGLTLDQAKAAGLIKTFHFQIAAGTGGA